MYVSRSYISPFLVSFLGALLTDELMKNLDAMIESNEFIIHYVRQAFVVYVRPSFPRRREI
jgi:hypothetical protein